MTPKLFMEWRATALANPCLLACEINLPRFHHRVAQAGIIVVVVAGYECQEYGGPVWHVAISGPPVWRCNMVARRILERAGDAALGEWTYQGLSWHIRRRLTPSEWGDQPWGQDVRGTAEAKRRLAGMKIHQLPPEHRETMRLAIQQELDGPS